MGLSIAATGSTIILGSFTFVFGLAQVFAELDVVVSSLSIILMYQWITALYNKCVCRKCENCVLREDKANLELVVMASEVTPTSTVSTSAPPPMQPVTSKSVGQYQE